MLWTKKKPDGSLLERVETLERGLKALRIDWDEMYDRFRLLYARLAKRARDDLRRASGDGFGEPSAPTTPQAPRSRLETITNPLAKRLLQGATLMNDREDSV